MQYSRNDKRKGRYNISSTIFVILEYTRVFSGDIPIYLMAIAFSSIIIIIIFFV